MYIDFFVGQYIIYMYRDVRSLMGIEKIVTYNYYGERGFAMVIRKKTGKRLLATLFIIIMLCAVMATTAFAKNINNFTWFQGAGRYIINLGEMSPGSNINTSGIRFFCVATSPSSGTYEVVLQRKGFLGIWQNVGNRYTCSQGSELKYDPRNGGYVNGQPSLLVWSTNITGEYRIILENATVPQATVFTRVEAWAY